MEFSERIKKLRNDLGFTQNQLAEALDVTIKSEIGWEEKREYPSTGTLKKIAKFFHISVNEIINSEELSKITFCEMKRKKEKASYFINAFIDFVPLFISLFPIYIFNDDSISNGGIRSADKMVSLMQYSNALGLQYVYGAFIVTLAVFGLAELILCLLSDKKALLIVNYVSIIVICIFLIFLFMSAQIYLGMVLTIILAGKVLVLYITNKKITI